MIRRAMPEMIRSDNVECFRRSSKTFHIIRTDHFGHGPSYHRPSYCRPRSISVSALGSDGNGPKDPRSTDYIISTFVKRRNKIGRTYVSKILPLDHFRVENQKLVV